MRWVSKRDLFAIAALLLAALLLHVWRDSGAEGARYEILAGGQVLYSGHLDRSADEEWSVFPNVTVALRGGLVGITQSDCPDKTCVRTGFIGVPGQITACLPNGLLIRIAGDGGVDAVL